jgi:hypothetical protein
MVFFTFSTIFTNKKFMDPSNINSTISSMPIAPGLGVILFSVFFVIYAQNSFIKYRKSEFGLLMVLGMTNQNIQRIMLLENGLIAVFSLLTGLVSGTIFSRLFYLVVIKIIDVDGIPFSMTIESYLYTAIFFIVVYSLVISSSIIASLRFEIVSLLKATRKEDKNLLNSPIWVVIGIVFIGISFFDLKRNYNTHNSMVLLRSMAVCFVGLFLFISNIVWFISKVTNLFQDKLYKNILFIADLKYTFGQSKKILFLVTLLASMTIFFCNITVVFISDSQRFATEYNPYHMAYAEIYGKNVITASALDGILKNSETPLTSFKAVEFISKPRITILSDENLNTNLGTHINVEKGYFISLFQIVKDDGFVHDTSEISSLDIPTNGGNNTYKPKGKITEVLFNNIPIVANGHYVILNKNDYQNIKINAKQSDIGNIKLMNFKDWYKTGSVLKKLRSNLETYNRENTKSFYENINNDIKMFKPASRIGDYLERKQAGSFLLFLFSFVGILFFVSSAVILHFKLLTEYESEKVKYKKLYKIGITDNEVSVIISKELRVLFFLPFILATLLAAFYNYNLPLIRGEEMASLRYSLIIGLIYLGLQIVFYSIYKKMYVKRLIQFLGK